MSNGEKIKVVHAPRRYVDAFSQEVAEILGALDVKAMVTDESYIGDFWALDLDEEGFAKRLDGAGEKLGIKIEADEKVHEAAARLFRYRNGMGNDGA